MKVNFITLKWGTKYGPEYVNRLYKALLNIYSGKFDFYCFTDDSSNILPEVIIRDIAELRTYKANCFTIEKMFLFDGVLDGNNVILDLDILIQKDLYPYLKDYGFIEGRLIQNEWNDVIQSEVGTRMGTCCINSSFVTWKGDQLKYIIDFFKKHQKIIEFKYGDLDTFLYQGLRKQIKYHPPKLVMSYNYAPDDTDLREYPILIFNTSHGKDAGVELHNSAAWVVELWKRFD